MYALNASNVKRKYGAVQVLDGLSLRLEQNGFDALMGPSGSGKSTFLHIACGLVAADSGSVEIGGADVTAMSDSAAAKFRRRHVGVVFQAFNLLSGKTVRDNVLFPLKLDGARPDGARMARLASVLGVEALMDRMPESLSGGEQQRVAIMRALAAAPEVVLADEPTGNLDAAATRDVCALLKSASSMGESAILVVTHDPIVAATADNVHFLKDGVIVASHPTRNDPARVASLYLEACS